MEENKAVTALQPFFDQESIERLGQTLHRITDAFYEFAEALATAIKPIIQVITSRFYDLFMAMLHSVATPKEWHLMHHAKKWRVRKKYRNRLARRLLAQMKGGGCDG